MVKSGTGLVTVEVQLFVTAWASEAVVDWPLSQGPDVMVAVFTTSAVSVAATWALKVTVPESPD
jgi:hypothetical protein